MNIMHKSAQQPHYAKTTPSTRITTTEHSRANTVFASTPDSTHEHIEKIMNNSGDARAHIRDPITYTDVNATTFDTTYTTNSDLSPYDNIPWYKECAMTGRHSNRINLENNQLHSSERADSRIDSSLNTKLSVLHANQRNSTSRYTASNDKTIHYARQALLYHGEMCTIGTRVGTHRLHNSVDHRNFTVDNVAVDTTNATLLRDIYLATTKGITKNNTASNSNAYPSNMVSSHHPNNC